jgi:ActR/RegA family two-component response regulator
MADQTRVLIADDEETFLLSTADLFRGRGMAADVARSGTEAIELLNRHDFDLIVTDIRMPGNADLALVAHLERTRPGTPVILVTGYPSLTTAVSAIRLPVMAYLVKPLDFEELIGHADRALADRHAVRALTAARQRASRWEQELELFDQTVGTRAPSGVAVAGFIDSALRNVVGTMRDVRNLTGALTQGTVERTACQLLNCPRQQRLLAALEDTVAVLEETKTAFKSKQLAELRRRLEAVIASERHPG